jgi:hypothetical protein
MLLTDLTANTKNHKDRLVSKQAQSNKRQINCYVSYSPGDNDKFL